MINGTSHKEGTIMLNPTEEKRFSSTLWTVFQDCIDLFRAETGTTDMPLHTFYMFLLMPRSGDISVTNLCKQLSLSQAAISRNLAVLAGVSRIRKDGGFGLVEGREDPMDRRHKQYCLSSEGKALRDRLEFRMLKRTKELMRWDDDQVQPV